MRAMTIAEFGSPEGLKIQQMPEPTAAGYDLLVEVHASSLNPVDTKVRQGGYSSQQLPLIGGFDVSGVVRAVGEQVEQFAVGDQVYASPSLARPGAHAELVCVDARTAAKKPVSLDHVQAAAMPLVTLTAWESLHERAGIHSGETVLIQAGAGGVGHIALQLARQHECRVLTTASEPESIELCREHGAETVINYKEEDFVQRVQQQTRQRGCEVVFDTVGGATFDQSLQCVRINGRMVTIVANHSCEIVPALFRKNATLHLEFMGVPTIYNIHPERQGEILRTAAELVDAGKLRPHVGNVIDLKQIPEGHRELEAGHVTGKIAVRVR